MQPTLCNWYALVWFTFQEKQLNCFVSCFLLISDPKILTKLMRNKSSLSRSLLLGSNEYLCKGLVWPKWGWGETREINNVFSITLLGESVSPHSPQSRLSVAAIYSGSFCSDKIMEICKFVQAENLPHDMFIKNYCNPMYVKGKCIYRFIYKKKVLFNHQQLILRNRCNLLILNYYNSVWIQ